MSSLHPPLITADTRERMLFAEEAADFFNKQEHTKTYSRHGQLKCGELFAVRWMSPKGQKVVSVLVFRLPHDAVIVGDLDRKLGEMTPLVVSG